MTTLVQWDVSVGTTVSLPGTPTPGNVMVIATMTEGGLDNGVAISNGFTQPDSGGHGYYQANGTFGGRGRLFYRVVQPGDTAGPYTCAGWSGASNIIAEFAPGVGTTELTSARAISENNASTAVALTSGSGISSALVVGGVSTTLNGGTLTPGTGVNVIPPGGVLPPSGVGHDRAGILWRDGTGPTTLDGTLAGAAGGYYWGMQIIAFSIPAPPPPVPEIVLTINGIEFRDLVEKSFRAELNGDGSGSFRIHRGHPQATEANLARGNIVSVTIPEIDDAPIFEFLLEEGDFDLLSGQ